MGHQCVRVWKVGYRMSEMAVGWEIEAEVREWRGRVEERLRLDCGGGWNSCLGWPRGRGKIFPVRGGFLPLCGFCDSGTWE